MAKKNKGIQHPDYEKAPMDRREFIRRAAVAGAIAGATGYLAWAPENWPGSLRDHSGLRSVPERPKFELGKYFVDKPANLTADVGVARKTRNADGTFSQEDLAKMLRASIDQLGGIDHFIRPGDVVLIKPNVAFDRSPALGATSNPDILETLIRMVKAAGAKEVRVADNPIESAPDCFEKSKVKMASEKGGARIFMPDSMSFKNLATPGAELIQEWAFFSRPFVGVNKVIGLSPVKDHNLCYASMGIKNWYGLLGGTRNQFHQDIHAIVSDLALMLKPTMTILDGTNVLMQNGPTGGDPSNVKKGDMVLAGLDPVALDSWAFEHALERDPNDKPVYLAKAEAKGCGKSDYTGRVKEVVV